MSALESSFLSKRRQKSTNAIYNDELSGIKTEFINWNSPFLRCLIIVAKIQYDCQPRLRRPFVITKRDVNFVF